MTILLYIIGLLLAGVAGFALAWFIKNREAKLIQDRKGEQENKFKAIATDVLRLNSEDFLKLAQKDLAKTTEVFNSEFANKEKGFEKLVEGVNKTVENLDKKVSQFEKERGEQVGSLSESVKQVLDTGAKINETATTLKAVLSSGSAIRGRWGETVLRNLLEESGLTEGVDFSIQETILGETASLRPDVIINLPGNLRLAIDSKASLEEFFKAIEEKDENKKLEHIQKFVANLKNRIKDLSSKEYQDHLDKKIPYVVMFIPGESAVRAAFEQDVNLYREAQGRKVMLASPATIIPLVLLVAHAWKQYKSAENAVRLGAEVAELGNRLKIFFSHVYDIGTNIAQATKKFNAAVGSWEGRIVPKIDQIKDLGGDIQTEKNIKLIEEEPRMPKKLRSPISKVELKK